MHSASFDQLSTSQLVVDDLFTSANSEPDTAKRLNTLVSALSDAEVVTMVEQSNSPDVTITQTMHDYSPTRCVFTASTNESFISRSEGEFGKRQRSLDPVRTQHTPWTNPIAHNDCKSQWGAAEETEAACSTMCMDHASVDSAGVGIHASDPESIVVPDVAGLTSFGDARRLKPHAGTAHPSNERSTSSHTPSPAHALVHTSSFLVAEGELQTPSDTYECGGHSDEIQPQPQHPAAARGLCHPPIYPHMPPMHPGAFHQHSLSTTDAVQLSSMNSRLPSSAVLSSRSNPALLRNRSASYSSTCSPPAGGGTKTDDHSQGTANKLDRLTLEGLTMQNEALLRRLESMEEFLRQHSQMSLTGSMFGSQIGGSSHLHGRHTSGSLPGYAGYAPMPHGHVPMMHASQLHHSSQIGVYPALALCRFHMLIAMPWKGGLW
jgi:hypothetical protein